jgi:hypothetical protein
MRGTLPVLRYARIGQDGEQVGRALQVLQLPRATQWHPVKGVNGI